MSNLNLKVTVADDRRVTFQLPDDVEPGEVQLTVVVHPQRKLKQRAADEDPLADWPTLHVESWPDNFSFRREEMYGDDGR